MIRQVLIMSDHYAVGERLEMIVSPTRLPIVKRALINAGIKFDVIDSDVQKYVSSRVVQLWLSLGSVVLCFSIISCLCFRTVEHTLTSNGNARKAYKRKARKARAKGQKPPVPDYYMQYDEV